MSHTPGPWHYHYATAVGEESEDGDYNAAFGITSRSKEEFQADGNRGDLVAYVPWDCDHIANARLIAAAPELLEALQSLIALSDDGSLHIEGSIATEDPVITAARAAIAKAEGRE